MTPTEVAQFLRISKTSVYRLVARRVLPYYKVGGSLRFSRNAILNYLEGGIVSSSIPFRYDNTQTK